MSCTVEVDGDELGRVAVASYAPVIVLFLRTLKTRIERINGEIRRYVTLELNQNRLRRC